MPNRLQYTASPYLLQHKDNPVDWYPWCDEAFQKAKQENKPVFLSIGYSTCHWCHVMAHESFEDEEVARILNEHFVSVKVDREERPDIDSIYMAVCQAFTGSGGWPTSIFMTPDQKPFFAGTYFPIRSSYGRAGFIDLLQVIADQWQSDRHTLLFQAEHILSQLKQRPTGQGSADLRLAEAAVQQYRQSFDHVNGGFGKAPKFPAPHNLLFLMEYAHRLGEDDCLAMAQHTLTQMYRGGLFDHIGGGFSRYSTDARWLVPHFEKMLYDNALLIMAYCKAYALTGQSLYREVARRTADYVLREMTHPEGGFYSAQDADSDGEEGKYYVFTPDEILRILGETEGRAFNERFGITAQGNFEGKNIPNLLHSAGGEVPESVTETLRDYRQSRFTLHLDDKVLTVWNGLMIAAMCRLYGVTGEQRYLDAARKADAFIQKYLRDGDILHVSWREGKCSGRGFLDDYAAYLYAQLHLYSATLERHYLERGRALCHKVLHSFRDPVNGGFFLTGKDNEQLILQPKDTYDGAMPSGNSLMAWNLVRLQQLCQNAALEREAEQQLRFMAAQAQHYPAGYGMFLLALLDRERPPMEITVIPAAGEDIRQIPLQTGLDAIVTMIEPSEQYPLKNGKTTFYVCHDGTCRPPVNDLSQI